VVGTCECGNEPSGSIKCGEFLDLCSSSNIFRVIKSRRMRWAERVARMGERRSVYRVMVGKPEGKTELWMGG
jgi:hypothetical protein